MARPKTLEKGDCLTPSFLSAPHELYARGTVEVQGFRCFVHGDDETLFDDAVANWASMVHVA